MAAVGYMSLTRHTYNIDKATEYLTTHKESKSVGACARYVRLAIEAGGCPTYFYPHNANGYFSDEEVSLKSAFAMSLNSVAVRVGMECGVSNIAKTAYAMGVKTKLQELGELLYATHTGTPTESEVLFAKMEEIDALKAEIAELEAALGRAKNSACETCGAEIQEGDAFCRECGDVL